MTELKKISADAYEKVKLIRMILLTGEILSVCADKLRMGPPLSDNRPKKKLRTIVEKADFTVNAVRSYALLLNEKSAKSMAKVIDEMTSGITKDIMLIIENILLINNAIPMNEIAKGIVDMYESLPLTDKNPATHEQHDGC